MLAQLEVAIVAFGVILVSQELVWYKLELMHGL